MAKTKWTGLGTSAGINNSPYAPGMYKFRVKEFSEGISKAGNTKYTYRMEILEAPEQEGGRDVVKKRYTQTFTNSGNEYGTALFKDFLVGCGLKITTDEFDPAKPVEKDLYGKMGLKVGLDGQPQAEVKKWFSEADHEALAATADED